MSKNEITVQAAIHADLHRVWDCWTQPRHVTCWNFASPDWHCPDAENDLREGGRFRYTMAARDGSMSFDYCGAYEVVIPQQRLAFRLDDGRRVDVQFAASGAQTQVTETFEAEGMHPEEMQRAGWQSILDNFKQYVERQAA